MRAEQRHQTLEAEPVHGVRTYGHRKRRAPNARNRRRRYSLGLRIYLPVSAEHVNMML